MNKHYISVSQLAHEIVWKNKINNILEATVTAKAAVANKELMKLGKELEKSGINPTEEEVQAALLIQAVNSRGNLKNIDASDLATQIKEGRTYLNESGSYATMTIEGIGIVLGNAALIHVIAVITEKLTGKKQTDQAIKINLQKRLAQLKKITGFPAKAMETFFKFVVKVWGGGKMAQEVAGVLGTMFVVVLFLALGAALFPSVQSIVMITLSLMSFIGKAVEIINLLKHLWHIITNHETAIEKKNTEEIEQAIDAGWRGSKAEKDMGDMSQNAISQK
jgi:hypothetical protein